LCGKSIGECFDAVTTWDNPFAFILIFSLMGINSEKQPKLLLLGILISVILHIVFTQVGMERVERFHWIIYIFGVILIFTVYKREAKLETQQVKSTARNE
jgi:tellurite resistance protein TerC